MAYVIPVAALILDEAAAAAALNERPDFFDDPDHDRWSAVEDLVKLTSAPVESFSDENGDIYYIGIRVDTEWRIDLNSALVSKATAIRAAYPHPLIQAAQLAVVSEFC